MNKATIFLTLTLPLNSADNSLSKSTPLPSPPPIVKQLQIMPQIGVNHGSGIKWQSFK